MTRIMIKMSNILLLSVLILQLLTTITCSWNPKAKFLNLVVTTNDSMQGTAVLDLLDDHKVAMLLRSSNSSDISSNQSIQLIGEDNFKSECIIPYLNVTKPVKRVSHKTILIPANELDKNGKNRVKLFLVNMKNCKYGYAYNQSVPDKYKLFITSNSTDERFTAIIRDKTFCDGYEWCRLFFNPLFQKLEPLDFDLDFPFSQLVRIKHATSIHGNNLFATQFIDDEGTFRVRLYDLSANRTGPLHQEMFSIAGYKTKRKILGKSFNDHFSFVWYKMKSSGLSYCWRAKRSDDLPNVIHCSRFREDGSLMFKRRIVYSNVMRILQVITIPNGLIVISSKYNCNARMNECAIVQVAKITREIETIETEDGRDWHTGSELLENNNIIIKRRYFNIGCDTDRVNSIPFQAYQLGDSFEVQLLCISLSNFMHYTFLID